MGGNSRATIGDNSASIILPDDKAEAVSFVWNRLLKLQAERAWHSDQVRDLLKEANSNGVAPGSIRSALRLDKLSPEQRQKWKDELHAAAQLYGYEVTDADTSPDRKTPLWGYVERAKNINDEKKQVADELTELSHVAKDAGIDFAELRLLSKLKSMEDENAGAAADWWQKVDSLGTFLKLF